MRVVPGSGHHQQALAPARRRRYLGVSSLLLVVSLVLAHPTTAVGSPRGAGGDAVGARAAATGVVTEPGGLMPVAPARLLDTRTGTGTPVPAGGTVEVQVSGRGGVPSTGAGAALLTVTVTAPRAGGHLTAFPTGTARPRASNLNFTAGQTVANLVAVRLGTAGKASLYNGSGGTLHVLADIAGYSSANCGPAYGRFGPGAWPASCWRPYADTSPFNVPIAPGAPAHPRSAQIVGRVFGDIARHPRPANLVAHTRGSSGEPTYYVRSDDPSTYELLQVECIEFGSCSIDVHHLPNGIPVPPQAVPEGTPVPSDEPHASSDRHLTIVDQATGWEYDLWHVQWPPTGNELTIGNGGRTRVDGDGTATREGGDGTAAGFGSLAGRVRAEEMLAGRIDHALFVVIDCDDGSFVYPAFKRGGRDCAGAGKPGGNVDAPPLGARLQLRVAPSVIDGLRIPSWKKTLLHAMARYGMFFGDTGSTFAFTVETESGNQYTSLGHRDRWLEVATENTWPLVGAKPGDYPWEHHLGYFGLDADGSTLNDDGLTWAQLWRHLVVLDPCVSLPEGCTPREQPATGDLAAAP